jgi:phytoene/squalene synthetase
MADKTMSTVYAAPEIATIDRGRPDRGLAPAITWVASKQSYYTVRLLVDQERIADAYRAYAYFRWVDDRIDQGALSEAERAAFVGRQQALIDRCYRGDWPQHLLDEERLLVDLILGDQETDSGLQAYIRQMMAVMAFDAERRGRLISEEELHKYTYWLAAAVTEALHHFIGHGCKAPQGDARYLAATGAHITHMLRDAVEDAEAGYFNIPRDVIEAHSIDPRDVSSAPYRSWVRQRVQLARDCFEAGRDYLAQVENPRCRLAGYAYIARFDGVLDAIERDGYHLQADYPKDRSLGAAMSKGWAIISQAFPCRRRHPSGELSPGFLAGEGW